MNLEIKAKLDPFRWRNDVMLKAYITSMHVLSAISLPVGLFGVFCIATKSPPVMKEYSRLLLLYQICATLCDTWINVMFIPISFFPFPILYHVGLFFSHVHLDYPYVHIIFICLIVTTMTSIVQIFIFRWQNMLMGDNHALHMEKRTIYAVCITLFIAMNGCIIGAGFSIPNRINEMKPMLVQVLAFPLIACLLAEPVHIVVLACFDPTFIIGAPHGILIHKTHSFQEGVKRWKTLVLHFLLENLLSRLCHKRAIKFMTECFPSKNLVSLSPSH
ncbi:unnamed protein product [Heligmosomoides polygyrus]|uniref:Serpentine Receptor, class T n=1 Tax=Heligmosomoides polygyrus TaxID=6339 RepID=A0A183FYJ5_HELPZ|nr:unnamed protein product [Heligmosomoides polygyrus]